jgi:hypothetical protein
LASKLSRPAKAETASLMIALFSFSGKSTPKSTAENKTNKTSSIPIAEVRGNDTTPPGSILLVSRKIRLTIKAGSYFEFFFHEAHMTILYVFA